ncbi:MAG: SDR family NAD(P)-dependent oxidoreductase [Rhodospirillaceae bacterium]|nr:SDR family NAD(P)-dependent oxidoreductase [Rhodospirillaceae bacterium]
MPRDQHTAGPVVAVTGATGFIGRHVVRALIEEGYTVRALARRLPKPEQFEDDSISWVLGSLGDDAALKSLVKDAVAVVHGAGAIRATSRDAFFAVNADATRRLAEIAAAEPAPPRFVHLSSLAAREPRLSPYAASKRAGEQALRGLKDKLPTVVLRPPAVYGPGDLETLRIFQMAARGFVLRPMVDRARTSLVHGADVAGAVIAALAVEAPPSQPVEFDDGRVGGYTWEEIAQAAGSALRTTPRLIAVPAPVLYAAGAVASLTSSLIGRASVLSWSKIPELLHPDWAAEPTELPGYNPEWNIDLGFKDAVSWYASRGLLTK